MVDTTLTAEPSRPHRVWSRRTSVMAGGLAAALLLASCTTSTVTPPGTLPNIEDPDPISGQAPEGFEDYYSQTIDWRQCEGDEITTAMMPVPKDLSPYQCGTLEAPMNWDDPASQTIELGVARYLGAGNNAEHPPLFYNLGGPGGGAIDSLSGFVENIVTTQIASSYNIIALDPRGVGSSSPIWCMTDEERDQDNALDVDFSGMTTEEIIEYNNQEVAKLGAQCLERNGEILGFVDSDSAARDFDMTRAVLGAETFDYLGFSYGTLLGAIYAELFPDHVGNFVLDAVLDPSLNINEVSAAQIAGMEASLYNWIESCTSQSKCALGSTLEAGKETVADLLDEIAAHPLPTTDEERPLNIGLASTAIIGSLYSTETYPILTQAVSQALKGDGSALLFLADFFNDRGVDGVYGSNSSDAFIAVNMLDYEPVGSAEEWAAEAEVISEKYPILGANFGFASAGLAEWPVDSRVSRSAVNGEDVPPMLLIGTTNDPATPYFMAQNLHRDLPSSVLLTVDGWNHAAYSSAASTCVIGYVDRFLLNGELPANGVTCDQ